MASSLMKSVLFCHILLLFSYSSSGALIDSFGKVFNKGFPKHVVNKNPTIWNTQNPKSLNNRGPKSLNNRGSKSSYNIFWESQAKNFGEKLANKYFGDKYIKGFRWGYKQGKRIHSVAHKCEDFMNVLYLTCPQPVQTSPLLNSPILHCIVEVSIFGKNNTCLQPYEKVQYPPEATCILDQPDTLVRNCTRNI